ncbi:RimK family alpha-L-glutamate ligase [Acidaminobacter sp. JC074]|uniref:ATP-grasp domain-containing protein n=1 Tax=Acidaminobacter sp. JC074 TaxID=2530199 RepID=UPI001F0E983D|nr:ATP-grasp domain-containing protein [Acidaminobacter sp. JC074]
MRGYLIYDQKDVDRSTNRNFINWLIDEAKAQGLDLYLVTQNSLPDKTPDFIINRSRFYELSVKYDCIHFNDPEVTKVANDKWLTYQTFKGIVPMMKTWLVSSNTIYPIIIKSRYGHGGDDVHLVKEKSNFSDDYVAQEMATPGKDLRVYILDNQIYEAVLRRCEDNFKSNYSLGGKAELYTLSQEETEIVYKVLDRLPIFYGGIDFLFKDDKLVLNEIEDPVGAKMLYNLTDKNIVKDYIRLIADKLKVKS